MLLTYRYDGGFLLRKRWNSSTVDTPIPVHDNKGNDSISKLFYFIQRRAHGEKKQRNHNFRYR